MAQVVGWSEDRQASTLIVILLIDLNHSIMCSAVYALMQDTCWLKSAGHASSQTVMSRSLDIISWLTANSTAHCCMKESTAYVSRLSLVFQ